MRRRHLEPDANPFGRSQGAFWSLAIYLAMASVALCGASSFGYLSFRSRDHSDVGDLPTFIAARDVVQHSSRVELWRGIPRNADPERLDSVLPRTFGWFESEPIPLRSEDASWLREFCSYEPHFWQIPPNTMKVCGWYHADWSVVFVEDGRRAEFSFCFGCGEVKLLVEGYEPLHVDFSGEWALEERFEPYRRR